jgi:hypothetical protein
MPDDKPRKDDPLARALGIEPDTRSEPERASENLRQYHEWQRSQTQQPPAQRASVSDPHSADTLTGRVLDYMGMGFLLVPPEIFVLEVVLASGPINWTLVLTSFGGCYIVGILLLAVGLNWTKIKPRLSIGLATSISRAANSAIVWFLILVLFAFGPVVVVGYFSARASLPSEGSTSAPAAAVPQPPKKPNRFPADLARINEALFKIHGIIRTELMGPVDRFQGTIQDIGDGVPPGGYGPMLTKLKGYLSEIDAAENDIKSVFEDKNYESYSNDLRGVVKPSGYYGNGRVNYRNDMMNFIRSMEMLSKKFSPPDGELNSVLSLLAAKLGDELADYTTWASQTLHKIEAEKSGLQQ